MPVSALESNIRVLLSSFGNNLLQNKLIMITTKKGQICVFKSKRPEHRQYCAFTELANQLCKTEVCSLPLKRIELPHQLVFINYTKNQVCLLPLDFFEIPNQLMQKLRRCLHDTGSSFIPVRLHPGSILSIYIRLHGTGSSFIPVRLHPGSILSIFNR